MTLFIRYMMARESEWMQEFHYRNYVSETLNTILENQAKHSGGKVLTSHFIDVYKPPVKEKTADEILQDLIDRGALEVTS